ncbi:MAG: hypothetical protein NC092_05295 [Butyrivibrio sp.]|nr:hypothetical protein [Muribaculum sp.]MCM1552090.1 hypothetical protein [Butyrivibrio sp.]
MDKTVKKAIKWVILIIIAVIAGKAFLNFVNPKVTDLTPYLKMTKSDLERTLGVSLSDNPNMLKKIYEYTEGEITVDGNSGNSFGIIYIDGQQSGLHTDSRIYGMYGIKIGDAFISLEDKITYPYERKYEVLNDIGQGASTATFYQNYTNNDCLVVVVNDTSNRVVALTYYSNGKKATEQLSSMK